MVHSLRLCLSAVVAATLACAGPAAAQTTPRPKPKQEEGVPVPPMRPAQTPDPPAAAPPPVVLASPLPSSMPDSAPRLGGLAAQARGGAQCRTDCARRYYRCLSQDEMSSCGPAWSRCLIACPQVSSSE
jgi:hypothetical protein